MASVTVRPRDPHSTRAPTAPAVDELDLDDRRRRAARARRPVGLGQVDGAADARRARAARRRRDLHRRPRRQRRAPARPRHRHGVPELRALPAADRRREHGLRAQAAGRARRRSGSRSVREAARILDLEPYLDRKPKNLSGGQRQRVAMGRAIVRRPAGLPDGRAALEPRRQAARADAHRARRAAGAARRSRPCTSPTTRSRR